VEKLDDEGYALTPEQQKEQDNLQFAKPDTSPTTGRLLVL